MKQIIECVPNFSEGRDLSVIKRITDVIESVKGVRLLNVDPGHATNRTVVTFVGEPEPVMEAAFRAIERASELIDMRYHKGEHPRFGTTDVCPLVPVSDITMEETVEYARRLAKRVGNELNIPVYCYEYAAFDEIRKSLANCRSGEYEGLAEKMQTAGWTPDFGPATFNAKAGATAIGARNFLIAYNINLNTTSLRLANAIAFDVREAGRIKREGDPLTGKIIRDDNGEPVRIPGTLKKVRAIGWFIKEYGIAQVSMNLMDITVTSLHQAFEEVSERARERGVRVTGSELIGMIPLQAMLGAGRYFLLKQHRSVGIPDREIIKIAVKSLGLDELAPFDPDKRIIEYLMKDKTRQLIDTSLSEFAHEVASDSPAPGGGSVAAYVGAIGVALGSMVANLSSHKRGWDDRWLEFSDWAEKGKLIYEELLQMVDKDTEAFNGIMEAFKLPRANDNEMAVRNNAISAATRNAIDVPFRVMKLCSESMVILEMMVEKGNPNSVTDAGVGALCANAAISGAYLNILVNVSAFNDKEAIRTTLSEAQSIELRAKEQCEKIQSIVRKKSGH